MSAGELWEHSDDIYRKVVEKWANELAVPEDVTTASMGSMAWEDSMVLPWIQEKTSSVGGSIIGSHIFTHPTTDILLLQRRQKALRAIPRMVKSKVTSCLKRHEVDMAWLFSLPPISSDPALQLLFPQALFIRGINLSSLTLALYHMYRGYLSPVMTFAGPATTIVGPYIYMSKKLQVPMPFMSYLKLVLRILRMAVRPSGDIRRDAVRACSMLTYIMLFVLGVIQSVELAKAVRTATTFVSKRLASIRTFVATAQHILSATPRHVFEAFGMSPHVSSTCPIPLGMRGMHALLTDMALRDSLSDILKRMYILDVCGIVRIKGMCRVCLDKPTQTASHAMFIGMGHVSLSPDQVRNPACLQRNLIITGPNAGGKTTYVRSMCANILLAQSFGVCFAKKALLAPYHAIGSFMRVTDVHGVTSLFEAEAKRCAEVLQYAQHASTNAKRAIIFLDEPMHATPPVEGAATSIAAIEHLGRLPGTRVVATTHFYTLTRLPQHDPTLFQNVSMEAVPTAGGFAFPFTIRKGPSFQCIALELLHDSNLPTEVIARATEWKNKICDREIRSE